MKILQILLVLLIILTGTNSLAQTTQPIIYPNLRLGFGTGIGVLVAGKKYATGGLSLSPNFLIGLKFKEWIGISYQNLPNMNSFNTITNFGIIDQNAAMIMIQPNDKIIFDLGPSLDLASLVLCYDRYTCARQTGFVGGGHLRVIVLGQIMSIGCGAIANFHASWIPSPYYTGLMFSSNIGPGCEW